MSKISESPLLRKIRALKAKAECAGTTEAEAAAFAAKVQELLVANGLSAADVDLSNEKVEEVGHEDRRGGSWSPARKSLMWAVCRHYMCTAIRYQTHWVIIGKPTNVFVANEMFDYLLATVIRLSNEFGRAHPGQNKIDWRRGCMKRLAERLDTMTHEAKEQPKVYNGGNPGNLPALFASENALVEAYKTARFQTVNAKLRIKQGTAAMAGRAAADGISLHRQVGGGAGRLALGKRSS